MYGLFCEHTVGHQMIWNGERGTVNFFQCELPYDVDSDFADDGYVGYYMHNDVKAHTGRAIGVYSNFQAHEVHAPFGIKVSGESVIESPFTRFLQNKGGIKNVIKLGEETYGKAVTETNKGSIGWVGSKEA